MDRRGFLGSVLALGAAPAIVRAEHLMKLWVPPQELVTPVTFDGEGDFTVEAWVRVGDAHWWKHVAEVRQGDRVVYLVNQCEVSRHEFIANGGHAVRFEKSKGGLVLHPGYSIDSVRVSTTARYGG